MSVLDLVRQAETDGRMVVIVRIEANAPDGKNIILEYRPGMTQRFRLLRHGKLLYRGDDEMVTTSQFLEATGIEAQEGAER